MCLPCLVLPSLSELKTVHLSLSSSLCSSFLHAVCTVTEDQTPTVSGANSPCFVIFWKCFVPICFVPYKSWKVFNFFNMTSWKLPTRHSALTRDIKAWESGGIVASATSPFAAHLGPPFAGKSSQPPSESHPCLLFTNPSGCWATPWGPLTPRHAQKKPQLPSLAQKKPQLPSLAQKGSLFLRTTPEGSWYPINCPVDFFWGGGGYKGSGCSGRAGDKAT